MAAKPSTLLNCLPSQRPVNVAAIVNDLIKEDNRGIKYGSAIVPVDRWGDRYADMAPGKNIQVRACAKPPTGAKSCTNFVQL